MNSLLGVFTIQDLTPMFALEIVNPLPVRFDGSDLVPPGETAPYNPDRYKLTTKEGFVYILNQAFGIETVTDPNGNTLTYTDNGIFHSDGKSVLFNRDAQGRIASITDPNGQTVMDYVYDQAGDLTHAKDATAIAQAGNGTQYAYNTQHAMTDINDPLDRPVIINHYDADGRLYAQEINGVFKYFDHQLSANQSIVTDFDGRVTIYDYDEEGNVLSDTQVIADGSYAGDIVTSYTYDGNNNQETRTIGASTWTTHHSARNDVEYASDPEGNTVYYNNYNLRGQEGEVVDERGNSYTMHYDSYGNLYQLDGPTVIDPDTGTSTRTSAGNVINAKGQVTSTTDMRGHTTTYTYYPDGHAWEGWKATESSPETGTITYTYDANGNVKSETRERTVNGLLTSETTSHDYDAQNRVIKTTYPDGTYTETTYDLAGNVDLERDRFGQWTDYDYDAYRRLVLTTYADTTSESRAYYREGALKQVTDRSGHVTFYEYDDAGRQWKVTNLDTGAYTETRYTEQGWVKSEWDENRNLTEYEYNKAGQRTAVIRYLDGRALRHDYSYYANGELWTETDALTHTTTYVLNELDQRIRTEFDNGTASEQRFDSMGARTRSIDPNLIATDYGYDAVGRLSSVTPAVSIGGVPVPATTYTYDEVGNKLTQRDANNHTTSWEYDVHGRVTQRTLPEGQSETFVYDDVAHTQTHTDFNGDVTVTSYDVMGRVGRIDYQQDGSSEVYTYWPNDQVKTVTDANGVTEYYYDARDRLDYAIKPDGGRIDYAYDAVGNRTQVKVSQGATVLSQTDYTYDALNRLETITDAQGTTVNTYDDVGNLDTVTYANGLVTDYNYNTVNQLTSVTTTDGAGTLISGYTYGLDNSGRRDDITEASGRFTDYVYDDLYRLTDEIVTDSVNGNYSAHYDYDWVGNRTGSIIDGVSTSYAYDANDRLQSQGGSSYTYDSNGNNITETLDGITTTYHYDAKNKLTTVDKGGVTTGYSYDHNGIRTGKTEAGTTTNYLVDENRDYAQVLVESDGTNTVTYSYGHDLLSQDRDGQISYYQYDGLGSTRALTDSLGTVTDRYDYTAFGDTLNQTGTTENSYRFTGEQYDAGLDQYYLRARYYDPGVGRFTQMDSWMGARLEPITLHKYLYANANPVSHTDPSGNISLTQVAVGFSIATLLTSSSTSNFSSALNLIITDANSYRLGVGNESAKLLLTSEFKNSINLANQLGELKEIETYISFVELGGLWDYKSRIEYRNLPDIEAFGNFAFGATSAAWADGATGGVSNSFPDLTINLAMRGAGLYQEYFQKYDPRNGHWYDFSGPAASNYGDQFKDQADIYTGAQYYFTNRNSLIP